MVSVPHILTCFKKYPFDMFPFLLIVSQFLEFLFPFTIQFLFLYSIFLLSVSVPISKSPSVSVEEE